MVTVLLKQENEAAINYDIVDCVQPDTVAQ